MVLFYCCLFGCKFLFEPVHSLEAATASENQCRSDEEFNVEDYKSMQQQPWSWFAVHCAARAARSRVFMACQEIPEQLQRDAGRVKAVRAPSGIRLSILPCLDIFELLSPCWCQSLLEKGALLWHCCDSVMSAFSMISFRFCILDGSGEVLWTWQTQPNLISGLWFFMGLRLIQMSAWSGPGSQVLEGPWYTDRMEDWCGSTSRERYRTTSFKNI